MTLRSFSLRPGHPTMATLLPMQANDDQYPPEEAQRRFDALLRAVLTSPPLHLKDVPRTRPVSKHKAGKAAKPPKNA